MQLGRVYDAACELLIDRTLEVGADDVMIPVVAECDDSFLSESRAMQVEDVDVSQAWGGTSVSRVRASHLPRVLSVSGTGMACLGLQGRDRYVVAGHAVRAHRRRAADDELR